MSEKVLVKSEQNEKTGSLLLGTGLAFAALIVFPAVATRMGLGSSLTGAMRIALMKASSRATGNSDGGVDAASNFSCH
ncbi:MAG: hypothetical protein V3V31_13945 [Methylococcales bacterium]